MNKEFDKVTSIRDNLPVARYWRNIMSSCTDVSTEEPGLRPDPYPFYSDDASVDIFIALVIAVPIFISLLAMQLLSEADARKACEVPYMDQASPAYILDGYRDVLTISAGSCHDAKEASMKVLAMGNQDTLLELVVDHQEYQLTDAEITELIFLGVGELPFSREYDETWAPFMQQLQEHREALPVSVQRYLGWMSLAYGW